MTIYVSWLYRTFPAMSSSICCVQLILCLLLRSPFAMAADGNQAMLGLLAAGDMAAVRVVNLEAERRMLQTAAKTKAAELKEERLKRARIWREMAASTNKVNRLETEVGRLKTAKVAKTKEVRKEKQKRGRLYRKAAAVGALALVRAA